MGNIFSIIQSIDSANNVRFYEEPAVEGAWFRYEDSIGYGPEIWLRQFRVIRTTPKGVWLDDYGRERFVLNDAHKRFAYPTIELARKSFLIRKRRQLVHLKNQIGHVTDVLEAAEEKLNG